ncbi:DUF2281 domain-containing protein [Dolichospermum sp. ST_sed1]|jgi:hypothetical protein|nr:DUF2281 domain-containing protein [Dolichospermum sp. DET66]MBS3032348.1 DUF2281 domain-containing protein [Dolichospermum sp. DET67]MBS3037553.1 DUF2281 domain-containing protein [Dolichospermum sp. DET50]MDD1421756.1 DUF2281 domain-containing protein [Dolichospermum sp. ST_sed1]MDD1424866.1 DUF2281 domain-containing protein [Dolichospermum sp. ST_sed9]MDD1433810.1 DUF2281 domain-containing protein [Dolichospermum sp. ST_sed6]MDD1437625.1 DUF2281 domain-containing protein [Dolichospermum 
MTIAEQIYALVKTLPQDQAEEILTFAEFIHSKHLNTNQVVNDYTNQLSWTELVYSLAGTWKEDFSSLEEIRAGSGLDIADWY